MDQLIVPDNIFGLDNPTPGPTLSFSPTPGTSPALTTPGTAPAPATSSSSTPSTTPATGLTSGLAANRGNNNNNMFPQSSDPDIAYKMFTTIGKLEAEVKAIKSQSMAEIAELKRANKEALESLAKRKKCQTEFSDPDPEDPSWQTNVAGELDNGSTSLPGMSLRCSLKPPNICPSKWPWDQTSFPDQISLPKRSTTLVLEHLTGSKRPHNSTIFELHERALPIKLKKLLSKNGAPGQEPEFKFKFNDIEPSANSTRTFRSDRDWKLPDSCHDVMDGVMNYGALVSLIRPWSYEVSKHIIPKSIIVKPISRPGRSCEPYTRRGISSTWPATPQSRRNSWPPWWIMCSLITPPEHKLAGNTYKLSYTKFKLNQAKNG